MCLTHIGHTYNINEKVESKIQEENKKIVWSARPHQQIHTLAYNQLTTLFPHKLIRTFYRHYARALTENSQACLTPYFDIIFVYTCRSTSITLISVGISFVTHMNVLLVLFPLWSYFKPNVSYCVFNLADKLTICLTVKLIRVYMFKLNRIRDTKLNQCLA